MILDKPSPFLVGLSGAIGVGKTTIANSIIKSLRDLGLTANKLSFATPIYKITEIITGLPESRLRQKEVEFRNESIACLNSWTPRMLLQKIGVEMFRHVIDENI